MTPACFFAANHDLIRRRSPDHGLRGRRQPKDVAPPSGAPKNQVRPVIPAIACVSGAHRVIRTGVFRGVHLDFGFAFEEEWGGELAEGAASEKRASATRSDSLLVRLDPLRPKLAANSPFSVVQVPHTQFYPPWGGSIALPRSKTALPLTAPSANR